MSSSPPPVPRRVVIVGGGVAALETVLALDALAPSGAVTVTLLAPESEFTLRPLDVARPFARGRSGHLDLASFMREHGGEFRRTAALAFDAQAHAVRCATGPPEHYDVLVLAVGAPARPAYADALTFGTDPLSLNGILADLEGGWTSSVAFVVPPGCSWPLPLYELALMTAEEVRGMGMDAVDLHVVTPEAAPLDVFGPAAAEAVADLLEVAGIAVHCSEQAEVGPHGRVALAAGALDVERVVALPVLEGPRLLGLPGDADGFLPVDGHSRLVGVSDVYAVGDAADHRVKQGGLACQQADVAAAHLAAAAGADVPTPPYVPVLQGRLLTGDEDRFLRRDAATLLGEVDTTPLWWPPAKASGRFLAPFLAARGLVELPARGAGEVPPLDVRVPAG